MTISNFDSVPIPTKASLTASKAPCESALITTGIRIVPSPPSSPSNPYLLCAFCIMRFCFAAVPVTWSCTCLSSSISARSELSSDSRCRMISLASSSEEAQTIGSPALGRDLKPTILTGWDGLACLMGLFATSFKNLTLPPFVPLTTKSPHSTFPHRITQSATTPKPFSILASMTIPSPFASSSALISIISLCNANPSTKSSKPSPVNPDTGNN
mmetsp:Transcript_31033/g.65478  ORF Transcript_31033/g.65478 Transcript_31033/m.65478 type:complete len:214 (-) Transcript_31033:1133-1774(-)